MKGAAGTIRIFPEASSERPFQHCFAARFGILTWAVQPETVTVLPFDSVSTLSMTPATRTVLYCFDFSDGQAFAAKTGDGNADARTTEIAARKTRTGMPTATMDRLRVNARDTHQGWKQSFPESMTLFRQRFHSELRVYYNPKKISQEIVGRHLMAADTLFF
jgi:hypothetical protein